MLVASGRFVGELLAEEDELDFEPSPAELTFGLTYSAFGQTKASVA
jgi:hypothetical protein